MLTSRIEDGMLNMNGFCYTDDGDAVPVSPRNFSIFDVLQELRDAMAKADGKSPWIAALSGSSARPASSTPTSNTSTSSAGPSHPPTSKRARRSLRRHERRRDHLILRPPTAAPALKRRD